MVPLAIERAFEMPQYIIAAPVQAGCLDSTYRTSKGQVGHITMHATPVYSHALKPVRLCRAMEGAAMAVEIPMVVAATMGVDLEVAATMGVELEVAATMGVDPGEAARTPCSGEGTAGSLETTQPPAQAPAQRTPTTTTATLGTTQLSPVATTAISTTIITTTVRAPAAAVTTTTTTTMEALLQVGQEERAAFLVCPLPL